MRALALSILALLALGAMTAKGPSIGVGNSAQRLPVAVVGSVVVTPLAWCSPTIDISVSMDANGGLWLPAGAPVGTVCNYLYEGAVIRDFTVYDEDSSLTTIRIYYVDGTVGDWIRCDNDATHDVIGCYLPLVKITTTRWTLNSQPRGVVTTEAGLSGP